MECCGGVEAEQRVGWVHETFLLVCLHAENHEPEVERRQTEEGQREEARRLFDGCMAFLEG